jgi:hypothetical protein
MISTGRVILITLPPFLRTTYSINCIFWRSSLESAYGKSVRKIPTSSDKLIVENLSATELQLH